MKESNSSFYQIGSHNHPCCNVCGELGKAAYEGLEDNLFGAPGSWNLSKCCNCGLVWLNPMPNQDEIWKAYDCYYTHNSNDGRQSLFIRIINKFAMSYIDRRYGSVEKISIADHFLSRVIYLMPGIRALADNRVCELTCTPGGKLLEIGCGSGKTLKRLQTLGWEVEGIDFDKKAVEAAVQTGLKVSEGELCTMEYPDNFFDMVISKHLIEHVSDPEQLLRESYRILKPKGKMVIYTPNSDSFGQRYYKREWRGFEPPRHLFVFNLSSLKMLVENIGFSDVESKSTFAGATILMDSYDLSKKRNSSNSSYVRSLQLFLLGYVEWFIVKLNKARGEGMRIEATKN